jgi:hypothetical protein
VERVSESVTLAAGDVNAAYAAALKAIELAPTEWSGFARLAAAAIERGEHSTAVTAARRAVQLNPSAAEAHAVLGQAELSRGKVYAARRAFADALRLRPEYPAVHDFLALTAVATGRGSRRASFKHLLGRVESGHLDASALPITVDTSVASRARWLGLGVSYASLFYLGGVLVTGSEQGYGSATVVIPLICSGIVAVAYLWWLLPLVWGTPAPLRRHLFTTHRRDRVEALGVWGYSLSVLVMLTVPLWWVADWATTLIAVSATAAALPILTEVLTVGLGFGNSPTKLRDVVVGVLTKPYLMPFIALVIVIAASVRWLIRPARRRRTT